MSMTKSMHDPRMAEFMKPENMPFDGKRLIWGGFEMVVNRQARRPGALPAIGSMG
ncbi:hypothetical protein [Massilia sp. SYSU DXS3249]